VFERVHVCATVFVCADDTFGLLLWSLNPQFQMPGIEHMNTVIERLSARLHDGIVKELSGTPGQVLVAYTADWYRYGMSGCVAPSPA
jgi:hypothetical protein